MYNANRSLRAKDGKSVLMTAASHEHGEVAEYLADPSPANRAIWRDLKAREAVAQTCCVTHIILYIL